MRALISCAALALFATPAFVTAYSTPPPGKAAPAIVPYECGEGRPASVIYESGNDYIHAKALVTYDGRTIEMLAAPTLYGVRYRSEPGGEGAPLAWSLRGEEALLTEAPDEESYTREERMIARCSRVRSTGDATAHAEGHDEDQH